MDTNGQVTDTPQEEKPAGTPYNPPLLRGFSSFPLSHIGGPTNE